MVKNPSVIDTDVMIASKYEIGLVEKDRLYGFYELVPEVIHSRVMLMHSIYALLSLQNKN